MNLKIIGAVAGIMVLAGCNSSKQQNLTHRFSDEVNYRTMDAIESKLDEAELEIAPGETFTLFVNSPGGMYNAYKLVMDRLNTTPLKLITVARNQVASAGAMLFVLGDERIVYEGTSILFHYVRVFLYGTHVIRELELEQYLNNDSGLSPTIRNALDDVPREQIEELYKEFKKMNKEIFDLIANRLGKEVAEKVLVKGEDVILTAEEALELGVATKLKKIEFKRQPKKKMELPNGHMPSLDQ